MNVPEQPKFENGLIWAKICSGTALVPIVVPEQQFLVLSAMAQLASHRRHVLPVGCCLVATAPVYR